jgi:branched-chain amino acid transport system ATP-binding protein
MNEETARRNTGAGPVLEADSVSLGYGSIPAVRDLSLSVSAGEIVALLGANGAGKSTTLMGLAGALPTMKGQVYLHGCPTKSPLFRRSRLGLAYLPEQRGIFRELTTIENLRLGSGDPEVAFDLIPELRALRRRKVGLLSGGEQQMLVLARALASEPAVLLCDELSLGLAPVVLDRLFDLLRDAAQRGVGMLVVEQHVRVALDLADRAIVLRRGNMVMTGNRVEMKGRMDEIESHYLSAV